MTRRYLTLATLLAAAIATGTPASAQAPQPKYRVGFMLPYSGTFAALGIAATNAFKLAVNENGGKLGGREVEYFTVDDESDPAKASENAMKLVRRDNVDVLVGTVHSGVALGLAKVARDTNTLLLIPNAGADELTSTLCAANIFRTSFSNWQLGTAAGDLVNQRKHKTAVTLTWKYAGGEQMVNSFEEAFQKGGGKVLKSMTLPFPNVEFQSYLTEIASLRPDAVYVFFAGAGAVKFVKDYAAAGLKDKIPLYATGFLTEGTLEAQGAAANGIETTLHYGDGMNNPKNTAFRAAYKAAYKAEPDVYAVAGYDTAQLLNAGLAAVKGDAGKRAEMIKAMESATIDSPRGKFTMSKAHNPVHDIYARRVENGQNKLTGVVSKALADPARGCKL